jgi:hypothetical protein
MNAFVRLLVAAYAPLHARYTLVDTGSTLPRLGKSVVRPPGRREVARASEAMDGKPSRMPG